MRIAQSVRECACQLAADFALAAAVARTIESETGAAFSGWAAREGRRALAA